MNTVTNDIHDIKGLVPVPSSWGWLWVTLGVLLVLALVGLGIWLWRRRKRPQAVPPVIARPSPHVAALEALRRLREENPAPGPFYARLADIVRQYLEGQFRIRAPEQTTEEFLHAVSRDNSLSPAQKALLGAFLQEADMVKFARHVPSVEDRDRTYEAARAFVVETGLPQPAAVEAS